MKPKMMTSFGWPEGNCFAACVASIFEVEIEQLPNGGAGAPPLALGEALHEWIKPWQEWLRPRGLYLIAFDAWKPEVEGRQEMHLYPGFSILSCSVLGSPSMPDGTELRHAVVALDGAVVHDPQPGNDRATLWPREYQCFIALDPAKLGGAI